MDRADEANLTVTNIQYGINTLLLPKLRQLQDFDINAIIYNVGVNSECFDSALWCFLLFVLTSTSTMLALTVSALTPPCGVLCVFVLTSTSAVLALTVSALTPPCGVFCCLF